MAVVVADRVLHTLAGWRSRSYALPKEDDMIVLHKACRDLFLRQGSLLELSAPVRMLGDIHGQYKDLLRWFELSGPPPEANYLFLGDYVDRGARSLEVILTLMAYKVKYPNNFFLLRGNHECASISRVYGFYDECKRRASIKVWKRFHDTFNSMPLSAVVGESILCMHGGLSPELHSLEQLRQIARPTDVPDTGLVCDLLWSNPEECCEGWECADKEVSFYFGADIVVKTLEKLDLELVVRAHQVVEDGYHFFADRRLVTLFSAPNYCGEFDNSGGMMTVDAAMKCAFKILPAKPLT
eukprot:Rhum_TRINITY_DN15226_c0_g1::Rhum_TRINITY_DN15226_c0_g1_i3::g.145545::m.145545/K06269/PPP1C; serine/threonine-protein phosphatase PP1 catalytic subunit